MFGSHCHFKPVSHFLKGFYGLSTPPTRVVCGTNPPWHFEVCWGILTTTATQQNSCCKLGRDCQDAGWHRDITSQHAPSLRMSSTEASSERRWDFLTKHCKWVHSFSVTGYVQCVKINGWIKAISRADSGAYLFTLIGTGTQDTADMSLRTAMLLALTSARRLSELTALSVDPCCCYPRVTAAGGLSD